MIHKSQCKKDDKPEGEARSGVQGVAGQAENVKPGHKVKPDDKVEDETNSVELGVEAELKELKLATEAKHLL